MPLHGALQAIHRFVLQLQRVGAGRNRQLLIKLQTINYHLHASYKRMENIISLTYLAQPLLYLVKIRADFHKKNPPVRINFNYHVIM